MKNDIDAGMKEKDKSKAPEQRETVKETQLPK